MSAKVIDGKAFAAKMRAQIATATNDVAAKAGRAPGLAVVLVGEDPASQVYVRNKGKQTKEVGMASFTHNLPETTTQEALLALIAKLNQDEAVDGILVQLPLPKHMDEHEVINAIAPEKDVDGFHVINSGKLITGQPSLVPCTPLGCLLLLRAHVPTLAGKHAVVLGRSNIVGKPVAQLLLQESCTVTIAHSRTQDAPALCQQADILVAAVGRPKMVQADWIKPGAVVIDVGINRVEVGGKARLVGDVDFDSVSQVASAITPVPGGVGPMTIACLLRNTLQAFCARMHIPMPPLEG